MTLRVGLLTDQYPSHSHPDRGTFVYDLARNLRSAQVDVSVINHRRNFAAMSLETLIRSARLDLLDAQFIAPAGVVAALTPRLAPLVITVHRWDIMEFPYRWPLAGAATVLALRAARGIIAVGRSILTEVMKFETHTAKIDVIPNAVDTNRFRPNADFSFIKSKLGIPDDHYVILSVGHLVSRKGFQYLIQAMTGVVKKFDSCTLVIAGEGPLRSELETMGRNLRIAERLRFPGVVQSTYLPSYYAMADLFVMPSIAEGHCVSILEAMSSGKPIVASAIPANAESVIHGVNGLLVPPKGPKALTDAILVLLRDDSEREKFGKRSRERAVRDFGWELRVKRLLNFYGSVLK